MNGYMFVEFSKATAKSNPQMIVREYDRIIKDLKDKTEGFRSSYYEIILTKSELRRWDHNWVDHDEEFKFKVSYNKLKTIIDEIHVKKSKVIKELEVLRLIEDELSKFKINF
jgi:hypothetical protein